MVNIKELVEKSDEGDILFIDEFMEKHKIVRGYGTSYILHQLLVDYREWILNNRRKGFLRSGADKTSSEVEGK